MPWGAMSAPNYLALCSRSRWLHTQCGGSGEQEREEVEVVEVEAEVLNGSWERKPS